MPEPTKTIDDVVAELDKLVKKMDKKSISLDKHQKKIVDRERKPMEYCIGCGRMLTNPQTGELKVKPHVCH